MPIDLDDLRRHAVARSLFTPTTLPAAIARLGFVQADPIRAPARAQDLTLRHRVKGYRAGDLERRYPQLAVEEDFFVNYGFLPRATQALMHPRTPRTRVAAGALGAGAGGAGLRARARRGAPARGGRAFPARQGDATGSAARSNASTQLLDGMHYRGLLRVARREGGVRLYAARDAHERAPADPPPRWTRWSTWCVAQVRAAARAHAEQAGQPPALRRAAVARPARAPRWQRAKARLPHGAGGRHALVLAGGREPGRRAATRPTTSVRLLAPFDPVVWDRRRFELLLGLGLPLRGLHAGAEARARLLRAAAAVARPGDRLGQPGRGARPAARPTSAMSRPGAARHAFRRALDDELGRIERFLRPR